MCRNKRARVMFDQCSLIQTYCEDYVDKSSNRAIAVDTTALAHMLNETLNRYFVPCFMGGHDYKNIGVADVEPRYHSGENDTKLRQTYLSFRNTFKIDMLEVPRTRKFLLPIVKEIVDDE
jgi:hypothetical protein